MNYYNYENIKDLAKTKGLRINELLALAPQNDPFYVGTPTDIETAQWFGEIWQRAGYTSRVHLRRIHYWIVSQNTPVQMPNGLPYENTEKCWQFLLVASKKARYLEYVRIEDIVDNKNPQPNVNAEYLDEELGYQIHSPKLDSPVVWTYGLHNADVQPYHLEVWCEKSTMNDVLLPVCRRFNANLVTFEGEVSITACYELLQRIEKSSGKPTRIWYISDFDPAGNSMPVAMSRKTEYMLGCFGHNFDLRIRPLALTAQQILRYHLPRIPIKETEKRAARFEDAFGTGAVELDALEALYPGVLARLLADDVRPYYSQDAASETFRQEQALRQAISEQVAAISARYQAEIEAVKAMLDEVQKIEIDPTEYAVERYEPEVEEDDNWLFDSQRPYTNQLQFYKAHKGIETKDIE